MRVDATGSLLQRLDNTELYRRPYEEKTIANPVEFDEVIRNVIKLPKLRPEKVPIVRYTLNARDEIRIAILNNACGEKQHPFYKVVAEEGMAVPEAAEDTEDIDELVAAAIGEWDSSEQSKTLLADLLRNASVDETLADYYRNLVSHVETDTN